MREMPMFKGKTWASMAIGAMNWYFKTTDQNGDGFTTKTEWHNSRLAKAFSPSGGKAAVMFDLCDRNRDGILSLAEMASDTGSSYSFPLQYLLFRDTDLALPRDLVLQRAAEQLDGASVSKLMAQMMRKLHEGEHSQVTKPGVVMLMDMGTPSGRVVASDDSDAKTGSRFAREWARYFETAAFGGEEMLLGDDHQEPASPFDVLDMNKDGQLAEGDIALIADMPEIRDKIWNKLAPGALRSFISTCDADSSGATSRTEYEACLGNMMPLTAQQLSGWFQLSDTNGDGLLTLMEMVADPINAYTFPMRYLLLREPGERLSRDDVMRRSEQIAGEAVPKLLAKIVLSRKAAHDSPSNLRDAQTPVRERGLNTI
eukprot:gnl/TRDRNA2_/TRDRNA2_84023_c1_seq1.p1 gnl/TRDRNA2_/TRDRNA2_84023_c1~~gnl/TRDRNA2_/TRDRNA2_84023_c1_seq1.p1  ORF type:complete len:403 (+),score=72.16 gnl/TRDRNA2_/TRDRNA2_84023_c1_seq1:98-1210(+)